MLNIPQAKTLNAFGFFAVGKSTFASSQSDVFDKDSFDHSKEAPTIIHYILTNNFIRGDRPNLNLIILPKNFQAHVDSIKYQQPSKYQFFSEFSNKDYLKAHYIKALVYAQKNDIPIYFTTDNYFATDAINDFHDTYNKQYFDEVFINKLVEDKIFYKPNSLFQIINQNKNQQALLQERIFINKRFDKNLSDERIKQMFTKTLINTLIFNYGWRKKNFEDFLANKLK